LNIPLQPSHAKGEHGLSLAHKILGPCGSNRLGLLLIINSPVQASVRFGSDNINIKSA